MKSYVISTPGVWRPMTYLAGPVLVQQTLNLLVGLVDTFLTGNFVPGEAPMAAIGLMAYTMWLIPSMFASIAIGATAMVARFVGADEYAKAKQVTNQAMLCGIGLAAIITALFATFDKQFIVGMGLESDAATYALRYLRYLIYAIPAVMVIQVGNACLRGAGDTIAGFIAMAGVNIVNVTVSAILATGAFGAPNLGFDGMAIGTMVGHYVGAVIVLAMLIGGRRGLKLSWRQMAPNGDLIKRLLKVGLPGGADMAAVLGCHLLFVRMITDLGTLQTSAHMLAVRVESIGYLPGTAFQVAAGTMAGQYLGAGDFKRASRGVKAAVIAGMTMMCAAGLLFFFGAEWLTALFTGNSGNATGTAAIPLLKIAAFAMPFMAMTMIFSGALRGAGDTRWPLIITLIGFLVIRIPLAKWMIDAPRVLPFFETPLPTGIIGAWYATVADLAVRSVLSTGRFLHGGWKKAKV